MTLAAAFRELDSEMSVYSPASQDSSVLPSALRYRLWECIVERLERGESLIIPEQYMTAMEEDYRTITQDIPSPPVKTAK